MRFKKIFILGAGAIGSVYGALLSEKNNVILIGERNNEIVVDSLKKIREKIVNECLTVASREGIKF